MHVLLTRCNGYPKLQNAYVRAWQRWSTGSMYLLSPNTEHQLWSWAACKVSSIQRLKKKFQNHCDAANSIADNKFSLAVSWDFNVYIFFCRFHVQIHAESERNCALCLIPLSPASDAKACKKCQSKFMTYASLSEESIKESSAHHKPDDNFCNLCKASFASANDLEEHLIKHSFQGNLHFISKTQNQTQILHNTFRGWYKFMFYVCVVCYPVRLWGARLQLLHLLINFHVTKWSTPAHVRAWF